MAVSQHPRTNAQRKSGKARIKTRADEYRRELTTRFDDLVGDVRERLTEGTQPQRPLTNAPPREAYAFPQNSNKHQDFMSWFRDALEEGILVPVSEPAKENGRHYTGTYVRSGYNKGLEYGGARLREVGIEAADLRVTPTFSPPIHREALEQLYKRQFTQLRDITTSVDAAISRELTQAIAEGIGPQKTATRLNEHLKDGRSRSETLARTEMLKFHNTAAGRRYQEYGVDQIQILTYDPCPECEALAAEGPFPVEMAGTLVPDMTHPRCVCSISPVI